MKMKLDAEMDLQALRGKTFVVIDCRELSVTLDGTEDVQEEDTVLDVVSRLADAHPVELWDLVDRQVQAA